MENTLAITDENLNELRHQISEQKKREEYARLKKDLFDITYKANHTLTEFDAGMKQVDTENVLSKPNRKQTLSEILIARFIKMCALRPITGNLIALALAFIAVFSLHSFLNNPDLAFLKKVLCPLIELAAGVQIYKSASRSLVLPIAATLIGAIISNQLSGHELFLQHSSEFYQALLITGLIGITVSIFTID